MNNGNSVTLRIVPIQQTEVRIPIVISARVRGHFFGMAIVRSKEEMKELSDRLEAEEFENDEEFLRACYTEFRGLGTENGEPITGEGAWQEVCSGKLSTFLTSAAIQAYFKQYGEALQGNSRRSRGR